MFDPSRLTHLKRLRDARYAVLRTRTTEQRDAAAHRTVEGRKLIDLRAEADRAPIARRDDLFAARLADQEAKVAAADAAFADAREHEERASVEWNEASRLYERCFKFAQEKGLELPPMPIIDGPDPLASMPVHGEVR